MSESQRNHSDYFVVKALENGVSVVITGMQDRQSHVEKLDCGEVYLVRMAEKQTVKISGAADVITPFGVVSSNR